MPLTSPDYGIGKTIQGGAKYSGTGPGYQAPKKPTTGPMGNKTAVPVTGALQTAQPQQPQQPAGYQDLLGLFNSLIPMAGPGIANANAQIGNQQGMLGQLLANQQYQGGLFREQGQNQLANLGLSQEGLQNQRDILSRQQGLLPQQNSLQEQLYGINKQALQANRGQLGQLNTLNQQDLSSAYDDVTRQFSNAKADLADQRFNFTGGQAARGAMTTPGTARGFNSLARQDQSLSDQLKSTFGNLERQGKRSDIGYQGALGDIGRAEQQQDVNRNQYLLNYQEQQKQLEDQGKALDLVSKQHNLSKDEIENRTNQALAQLGLSTVLSSGQIYQSILNAQQGKFDSLTPILGAIYQYIGLRPVANG